jgi:hypothetical protein
MKEMQNGVLENESINSVGIVKATSASKNYMRTTASAGSEWKTHSCPPSSPYCHTKTCTLYVCPAYILLATRHTQTRLNPKNKDQKSATTVQFPGEEGRKGTHIKVGA